MADPDLQDLTNGVSQVTITTDDGGHEHLDSLEQAAEALQLPNVLIVANVDLSVFESSEAKEVFESAFLAYDPCATFQYLKSFRRARIEFESPLIAAEARIRLHETEVSGARIKCFFAQPKEEATESSPNLLPPLPQKQFLISPPASPPVGWEPVTESEPVINYDLIHAIASLAPGEAHELHPQSDQQPGIIVHVCEDPEGFENRPGRIIQTKRPTPTTTA